MFGRALLASLLCRARRYHLIQRSYVAYFVGAKRRLFFFVVSEASIKTSVAAKAGVQLVDNAGRLYRRYRIDPHAPEIGRASCRERVKIWIVAGCLKKKKRTRGKRDE